MPAGATQDRGAQSGSDAGRDLTLVTRITEELAQGIVSGALAPGLRLRQDHLAAEFGASHVPVREAFRRLEARGLVTSEPRRGVRVSPIDAAKVIEVAEMRAAFEALALRHAVPKMLPADYRLADTVLAGSARSTSIQIWEEANRRFHRALLAPCVMPRLLAAIDDLHRVSARFLFAAWRDLDWKGRSDEEHRAILASARKGDVEAASALLSNHILSAGQALIAVMRDRRSEPAVPSAGQRVKRPRPERTDP
ncbi:DNA-binding transcriptional regulator, GntR family [Rhizobiales bacterium GAS188]|nr:DNA-binding transcriptional regulator, GntR family [Rhizobiales bacterium GAS188]